MGSGRVKRGIGLLRILTVSIVLLVATGVSASLAEPLTWKSKTPLPTPMSRVDATVLNGQIYAVGETDVFQYDPSLDQWSYAIPAAEQIFYPSVLTLDNTIYLVGGDAGATGVSDTQGIWTYDPLTGSTRIGTTQEPRFFADAAALNGKIYIVGGSRADSFTLSLAIEEFDPTTGVSQVVGQVPAGRFSPAVETDGTRIYIMGGQDETGTPTDTCWAFDPVTGEILEQAPMLTPVWNRAAFSYSGKIYLVGGITSPGGPFAGAPTMWTMDIQEYDAVTDTWQVLDQVPSSRFASAAALVGDVFYVMGGDLGQNPPIMSVDTDIVESASLYTGSNRSPVCNYSTTLSTNEGETFSYTPFCTDPDGDTLVYSIENKPAWASFDPATGTLSGTPVQDDVGSYANIRISVSEAITNIAAPTYGDFALTTGTYAGDFDWNVAVTTELGNGYRLADWNDLVNYYNGGGDLVALMDGLGFGWNNVHAFVTYNGAKQWAQDPSRYYFISRHDHHLPTTFTYLVHETLDSNMIDLGSWQDPRLILAVKNDHVVLPDLQLNVVAVDIDNDSYGRSVDCNDNDPLINPGATEIPYNGIDENCNGMIDDLGPEGTFRTALVELYNATSGDHWKDNSNWKTAPLFEDGFAMPGTECSWSGVSCDANGSIVSLYLMANNLVGSIPAELGNLSSLSALFLQDNHLSGSIPVEIGNLSNLSILFLYGNQLSGQIPQDLSRLTSLEYLRLESNQLSGPIPVALGSMRGLKYLDLSNNHLTGSIPSELGNLSNLTQLLLSSNQLSGAIPVELTNLTSLKYGIYIDNNALFSNDSGLTTFLDSNASGWSMTQTVSPDLSVASPTNNSVLLNWASIKFASEAGGYEVWYSPTPGGPYTYFGTTADKVTTSMEVTGLAAETDYYFVMRTRTEPHPNNQNAVVSEFSEELHVTTISEQRAILIDLYNSTSGDYWRNKVGLWKTPPLYGDGFSMPGTECDWFGVGCDLEGNVISLNFYNTKLTGPIPASLGRLTSLRSLDFYLNELTGPIPAELGNLTGLTRLDLGHNRLTGPIPAELGNLSNLTSLSLYANQMSGPIPAELASLSKLTSLALNANQFSGPIPAELGSLTSLTSLSLDTNKLTGSIPTELGNLIGLTRLSLNTNQLSGPIPVELGSLSKLQTLKLNNNQFTSILTELGNLTNLTDLSLGNNRLSGPIPVELGNLTKLTSLDLSYNQFSGPIPVELCYLTNLTSLKLQFNRLIGAIPVELSSMASLSSLDLGFNALYSNDAALTAFLDSKSPNWSQTQTVAPVLSAGFATNNSRTIEWTPMDYANEPGGYEVWFSLTPGGPYTLYGTTADKSVSSMEVTGLSPDTTYYFVARTMTDWGILHAQGSPIFSEFSDEIAAPTLSPERAALIDLYNSTNGDNWTNNAGWKTAPLNSDGFAMPGTECDWYGVTCDANGSITSLGLWSNNLVGPVPSTLGSLTSLTSLNLRANQLSGAIPVELGNLSSLTSLNLESNQFSGFIPAELGRLSKLIFLSLGSNQLSGSIPTELGNLGSLTNLNVVANQLSDSIPSELGNLTELRGLFLQGNQLSGPIPAELGSLVNLEFLMMNANQLSGPIPVEFGNLTGLKWLHLESNQLGGAIPVELGVLSNLERLGLYYNSLYTNDAGLTAFLDNLAADWSLTQTVAPDISVGSSGNDSITINWTPIAFTAETGGYEVWYSLTSGGPYTLFGTTEDKSATSMEVTGLTPGTPYYFVVRTRTAQHANNQSAVISDFSNETSHTMMVVNAYVKKYYQGQYSDSYYYITGGVAPYTVTLESGSFPPGVDFLSTSLPQNRGKYGGTPAEMGSWSFSIKVTDAEGHTGVSEEVYIEVVEGIVITTPSLPDAVTGQPYSATIAATGGANPGNYSWRLKTSGYQIPAGLSFPEGLTLYPESEFDLTAAGTISGIPTTAGTYEFIIEAQEPMWGGWDRVYYTINVVDPCTDTDGDGYAVEGGTCGPVDCNDADPMSYPGAVETVLDGIDQDCNGYDLTINITKAVYFSTKQKLSVYATSAYGADAALELEGYSPMNWKAKKNRWQRNIKNVAPADVPANVTVSGPEGNVSLPVLWK